MPRKKTLIKLYIVEWFFLLWVLFHPTTVSVRFWFFLNLWMLHVILKRTPWYESVRQESLQAAEEHWNDTLFEEIQEKTQAAIHDWHSHCVIGVLALLLAIFLPVNITLNYSEHMPENLRAELIKIHGPEGKPLYPIATFVIEDTTICVYEQYTYTTDRYELYGLKGMVPRFNDDGEYRCKVEVKRYAGPIYTGYQLAEDTAIFYYDAEISQKGNRVKININSKEFDPSTKSLISPEKLAQFAYLEFQAYRRQ